MNRIIKRIILAQVPNISDPAFSDDELKSYAEANGYGKYFTDNYVRPNSGMGKDYGLRGFFSKEVAGVGVQNPIIFFSEVHQFNYKKSNNCDTLIFTWRFDTNNNVVRNDCDITLFEGKAGNAALADFVGGQTLKSGHNLIGNFQSYDEAKQSIEEDKKQYKNIKF